MSLLEINQFNATLRANGLVKHQLALVIEDKEFYDFCITNYILFKAIVCLSNKSNIELPFTLIEEEPFLNSSFAEDGNFTNSITPCQLCSRKLLCHKNSIDLV